jgi:drug/metabolite transporter (DMT)-like permease
LGCCMLYGTNFAFGRQLGETMGPSVVSGLRFTLAALTLSPYIRNLDPEMAVPAVACGLATSFGYIGQALSLQSISAGKAGFICSLSVIVCPLLEAVFDKVKVTSTFAAAVLLSLTGVAALELTGDVSPNIGDLCALAQPLGFGFAFWRTSDLMRRNGTQTLPVTAVIMCVTAGITLAWMLVNAALLGHLDARMLDGLLNPTDHSLDYSKLGAIGYLGVVTTAMTTIGETKALATVTSGEASILFTTEPLWAAVAGWFLLGETLGTPALVGGSCILGACLLNMLDLKMVSRLKGPS